MIGRIPIPYKIMAKGNYWVMPYLLYKKWTEKFSSRTNRVAQ